MRKYLALLTLLALAASCSDSSGPPDARPTTDLNFLRPASDAPPLAKTSVTFTATQGENAEAEIWYHARPGETDSTKFLEFKVPGNGLARRPDGSVIGPGESVVITATVVDASRFIIEFQPSGLRFSPDHPAELRIEYAETDDDLDGDGDVDSNDDAHESALALWRQEQASQPWVKLASLVVKDLNEVRADIEGFTNYVVAY
jgi:hypothetical protein